MIKTATACLAAILLCSGCILTKEELDCWYDDMCKDFAGAPHGPAEQQHAPSVHAP